MNKTSRFLNSHDKDMTLKGLSLVFSIIIKSNTREIEIKNGNPISTAINTNHKHSMQNISEAYNNLNGISIFSAFVFAPSRLRDSCCSLLKRSKRGRMSENLHLFK